MIYFLARILQGFPAQKRLWAPICPRIGGSEEEVRLTSEEAVQRSSVAGGGESPQNQGRVGRGDDQRDCGAGEARQGPRGDLRAAPGKV